MGSQASTLRRGRLDVLVLHAGSLGDCVLALHLCRTLRGSPGAARVAMAARSSIARFAARYGLLDDAFTLDAVFGDAGAGRGAAVAAAGVQGGFDGVVSLLGAADAPIHQQLAPSLRERLTAVDSRPGGNDARHIVEQWVERLRVGGLPVQGGPPAMLELDPDARRSHADRLRARLGVGSGPVAVFHPGSGGRNKCCPLDALERVMEVVSAAGWTTAWMVGPDEVERDGPELLQRLAERRPHGEFARGPATVPVLFEESVERAAELLVGAGAYIGNDAGMTHAAAVVGAATVAIFGPTAPAVWRPLGRRVSVAAFPPDDARGAWAAGIAGLIGKPGAAPS